MSETARNLVWDQRVAGSNPATPTNSAQKRAQKRPDGGPTVGKVERVAKAICEAAGKTNSRTACVMCEGGQCTLWKTFREEARAAIRAMEYTTPTV